MPIDAFGKQIETVDWGEEVDYSGYQWFKDPPPPRPEVSAIYLARITSLTHNYSSRMNPPERLMFLNQASLNRTTRLTLH